MLFKNEIIIVGGGLAGLVCAIHLSKLGHKVLIIEKHGYPHHKVCGEYVSNEVLPYLKWLDCDPSVLQPTSIQRLSFSSQKGETLECKLPLGGFGISRYTLDNFLFEKAKSAGCKVIKDSVIDIRFENNGFVIYTQLNGRFNCNIAIGAHGKRSGIDQRLGRKFIFKKSSWLAVKAHYYGDFPDELVGLHNFDGGYCGVSKVEDNRINICYLSDYQHFKGYKNIPDFQERVLYKNSQLKAIFEGSTMIFDQPLSISQISFEQKEPVSQHILMIGDTAGLIHPLCGNGMAMAIHSAKICAEMSAEFADQKIDRNHMEKQYKKMWNHHFKTRMTIGRILSGMIRNKRLFSSLLVVLIKFPALLPLIIKKTHGKPISTI
ncbi:NAD(P)/FAD-dependent oxidoreductase [Pedobacter psychroterrae]|uniref:NAD(P)/FAD-dependent oxidoreductase n=1 Tax=Pedobacter psychroterrae TaxID=2530453 RepID=A0A4R0NLV6_9SPHI|nr:NAD(P)/FAD-dependent oxidoreductase [Pedobacter psychroterrae]TCD01169.1 NAD(P)/FAD-dependent oxidoreductase [Pedobacter psychroterrae]